MRRTNLIILLILIALVIVTLIVTFSKKTTEEHSTTTRNCRDQNIDVVELEEGACAPNFELPDLDGNIKELYANNNKPTFVNFWATWCGPCQSELPHIESAYQRYKNRVNFMMVNATSTEPNEEEIAKYMKKHHYTFPVVMDRREINVTFGKYKLVGIPVTFAIDPQGRIVFKRVGSINQHEIEQLMVQLAK